jgi:hypothetical protein
MIVYKKYSDILNRIQKKDRRTAKKYIELLKKKWEIKDLYNIKNKKIWFIFKKDIENN